MASPENQDDHQNFDGLSVEKAPPVATTLQSPKRKGGLIGRLLGGVTLLALIVGAGGYAAVTYQDKDPRLAMVAAYVEQGVQQARGLIDGVTGETQTTGGKITTRRTLLPAEEPKTADTPAPAPSASEANPKIDEEAAKRQAEEAIKAAQADADAAAKAALEKAEAERQAAEKAEAEARAKAEAERKAQAEAEARVAEQKAAEQKAAQSQKKTEAAPSSDFTPQELIFALEGRIDELGDEIKALRGRLDSPKNETRAEPEAASEKPAPAVAVPAAADGAAAQVVVAYALQRQLEAGRPFSDEIAALTRLGAPAEALAALTPYAENGAPTGEKLKAEFSALSKKLHGDETAAASGDLTEQLLHGASKFVKVRPSGQPAPTDNSFEAKMVRVEAALTHNDFGAAEAALETFHDAAKADSKAFAEALHARLEAERAAAALVHDAIAALGAKK